MIDLEKEFRTLKLLAHALIILGVGLTLGGFGTAIFVSEGTKGPTPAKTQPPPEDESGADGAPAPPVKAQSDYQSSFSKFVRNTSIPSGALGVVFLICGCVLRFIIRHNIDDKDETQPSDELFKAYAQQLMIAEREKQKNRKRLN